MNIGLSAPLVLSVLKREPQDSRKEVVFSGAVVEEVVPAKNKRREEKRREEN